MYEVHANAFVLDEEDADDIEKGYTIKMVDEATLELTITDGFGVNFNFRIENINTDGLKRSVFTMFNLFEMRMKIEIGIN